MLLKRLTEASGVSGNEKEVRDIIIEEIKDYVDSIEIDKIGNIIAHKKASNENSKTLMIAAHMDEIGLLVTDIDSMGLLKFTPVGGIDKRVLVSKEVRIGKDKIPGVIGAKPIHLQRPEERTRALNINELYIDFGAKSKEDAMKYVEIGDYVALYSEYIEFGKDKVKAKALDDRVGCAVLIELIKNIENVDFYGVFTVMEEIGCRGAGPAAFSINPDYGIVLEGTICADGKAIKDHMMPTKLGHGPAISLIDETTIYDQATRKKVEKIAEENCIPYQYRKSAGGGNDSSKIHTAKDGAVTTTISVPCRYIHSNVSVMDKNDFENAYKLVENIVNKFGEGEI